jgi:hypothetical protein
MAQGVRVEEYLDCTERYADLGLLDDVRKGKAWLGVGGTRNVSTASLYNIYEKIRERLGDDGHIHALGIARPKQLTFMTSRDWVQSSDATTGTIDVVNNRGPYRTLGARPVYLTYAMFAASALRHDTLLARAIKAADELPRIEQEELLV